MCHYMTGKHKGKVSMELPRTKIEYGTHHWPLATGCSHGADICAVSADCWARGMAHRFHQDFTPALHPERLADRMPRKPSRILVSVTGDMFGSWWQGNKLWSQMVRAVESTATVWGGHSFLFLTKNPAAYAQFNPWPANCWLGTSISGAETRDVQQARLDALRQVTGAGVLWVSYEPMLGPLLVDDLDGIGWLVMGPQNRGRVKPQWDWVNRAWNMADAQSPEVPLWEKSQLRKYLRLVWYPVQDVPLK